MLDTMLRDVASRGPWVSAHPDVILKMGVKEVLCRTKYLGWGTDTHLYRIAADFNDTFPSRLQSAGPRVLKQNRGNGGQGVWKVELISELAGNASVVRVLHAQRGSKPEEMLLAEFMARCRASTGRMSSPLMHHALAPRDLDLDTNRLRWRKEAAAVARRNSHVGTKRRIRSTSSRWARKRSPPKPSLQSG